MGDGGSTTCMWVLNARAGTQEEVRCCRQGEQRGGADGASERGLALGRSGDSQADEILNAGFF